MFYELSNNDSTVSKVLRNKEKYLRQDSDDDSKQPPRIKKQLPDIDKALSNWVKGRQSKNQPVTDAEVVVIPEATRQKRRDLYQQGTTDQHGHFKLPGLNPGEYTVIALEDLEDDYRDPEFLKSHEGIGQTIHLEEGEHKSISLRLIFQRTMPSRTSFFR